MVTGVHAEISLQEKGYETPGFMALNYGRCTPITVIVAHLLYGGILGAFYRLKQ